jgi:hypothetical protein
MRRILTRRGGSDHPLQGAIVVGYKPGRRAPSSSRFLHSRGSIMKFAYHLALLAVAGAYVAGCGPTGTGEADGGDDNQCAAQNSTECKKNIDCAQGAICEKADEADETGCCIQILCNGDEDCPDGKICDVRRGLCVPEGLCDPANPAEECAPGEVCIYVEGLPQCIDAGSVPSPDECTVSPSSIYAPAGSVVQVEAVGRTTAGALVPFADFTFASTVGTIDAAGQLTVACASPTNGVCTGTVTATSATNSAATCNANATVYAPPGATETRVVLFDQTSGLPISGAPAAVKTTGAAVSATVNTDANGAATFPVAVATVEAISVFPPNHQWHTVLSPDSNDIAFYTVPVPDTENVTGVKGTFNFDNVSTQGDIKLGLAGMAIPAAITDLNFTTLIGEIADYPVELEGVTDGEQLVPLPSGLVLELGSSPIKGEFVVFGEEDSSILWAIGGKVRLAEIGPIISSVTADTDNINVGSILAAVLPFFARFDHAVVTGLEVPAPAPRPAAPSEDAPVPYASWDFPELTGGDAVSLNTLLSQSASYTLPKMPCSPGKVSGAGCTDNAYASGAVVLTGVVVPGQGLVPLGLTAGLDDPDSEDGQDQTDGLVDWKATNGNPNPPPKGKVLLDYAPPHDGLEGNLFLTVALALDIDNLVEGQLGTSIVTHVTDSFADENAPQQDFLQHPGGSWTQATRTFVLEEAGEGAQFYRINLDDQNDAEWNIWFDEPSLATSLDVGALRPSSITGRDLDADIQGFRLGSGYEDLDGSLFPENLSSLLAFNGTNLNNLLYYLGAWVSTPCDAASTDVPDPHCLRQ